MIHLQHLIWFQFTFSTFVNERKGRLQMDWETHFDQNSILNGADYLEDVMPSATREIRRMVQSWNNLVKQTKEIAIGRLHLLANDVSKRFGGGLPFVVVSGEDLTIRMSLKLSDDMVRNVYRTYSLAELKPLIVHDLLEKDFKQWIKKETGVDSE